jgi:diacylglycerol kinase (ATP)
LPLGTENLLAKELGFIIEVDHLAAAIAAGRLRQIDLGRANGRYFTLMLTAGIDADIAHRLAQWRARPGQSGNVRHISYARHILASIFRYPFDPIELTTDDGTTHRGAMAMVFSATRYGLGLRFVPHANIDDGLLHWLILEKPARTRLLSFLTDVLRGRHLKRRDVQHGIAQHVSLKSEVPIPIQIDGDSAAFTPVKIDIHPRALAVIDVGGSTIKSRTQQGV